MDNKIELLDYRVVLKKIESQENHLLLGNGFNHGLAVNTSYKAIFNKMIADKRGIYKDVKPIVEDCYYDLERFTGLLEEDINPNNEFLIKYVRNKVKYDFMKATHEIVKSKIKNIYEKKNEQIYVLLQNFTNFFTLNYDSFLYLLLLNFKRNTEQENSISIQMQMQMIEKDMNERYDNIYSEIKSARENGSFKLTMGQINETMEKSLKALKMSPLYISLKTYSDEYSKGWKGKDIKFVLNKLLEEEKKNKILEGVDDGSRPLFKDEDFIFHSNIESQNLFFLHGAFHIYKDGNTVKKIIQQKDKALYDRLEEILNNEEQELVTIFQSENKISEIKNNEYLSNCFNKLASLSGTMVIIGSSLDDNDNHIFEQINKSEIHTLYISLLSKDKLRFHEICKEKFPDKSVFLFDAESITYEKPNKEEEDKT